MYILYRNRFTLRIGLLSECKNHENSQISQIYHFSLNSKYPSFWKITQTHRQFKLVNLKWKSNTAQITISDPGKIIAQEWLQSIMAQVLSLHLPHGSLWWTALQFSSQVRLERSLGLFMRLSSCREEGCWCLEGVDIQLNIPQTQKMTFIQTKIHRH